MDAPGYIITAAQMQLVKAEAVVRGWLPAAEITAYNVAIKLSWEQWGVFNTTSYTNYIANARVNIGTGIADVNTSLRK